jgi:hypothetical protein
MPAVLRFCTVSPEAIFSLCLLIPFLYAGLYALAAPSDAIRVLNKLMADTHRIEANTILGELFAAPTPLADKGVTRLCLRLAGFVMMAAGLFRLYSL